ncbi:MULTISPECIES: hypothetical protein [Actinomycetes]|nr:hypothetical protein [Streptomyces noursei]
MNGYRALTDAPWYPAQPGDRLIVTYEATDADPRWTETYEVIKDAAYGLVLHLVDHTAPDEGMAGWFGGTPDIIGDPVETPWMEAGPDRLAIIRGGTVVHHGHHALTRPDTEELRETTAVGADGTIGYAVILEREYTPAELTDLERKIITKTQEMTWGAPGQADTDERP